MSNPCITEHAPHLKDRFDELVKGGMSEREAGRKAAMEDFAKLNKELNAFKKSIGIKLSKEQEAGYKEPDNSAKVKEITDTYNAKIEEAKKIANEEAQVAQDTNPPTVKGKEQPLVTDIAPETKSGEKGKEPPPAEPTDTVGEGGKEPPIDTDAGVYTEDKRTELSFRGLQEVATEFGLDDVSSRERKSDLKLFKDAETEIKKWVDEGSYQKNIQTVINDAAERKPISDTQRVILENHIHAERVKANEIAKQKGVNSKDFKDAVNEIDRITKAAITSRQEAGAALRIPTTANNNTASLADAIIATKESKNVSELTDTETAEVQKKYQVIEDTNAKFQEYKAEAEAKFKEYQAKIEMLEAGKSTPKGKKTATDLKTEREDIKKSILEKWNKAKNVGIVNNPKEDLLIQLAPDIAKLMRNYYQDGVRQLGEMVDKIHTYLKDLGVGVEASDVQDMIAGKYNQKKLTKNEMVAEIKGLQDEAKALNELKSLMNKEPRNEKEKRKKNERLAEIRKQINALKKEQGLDQYSDQAKVDRAIAANKAKEEKYKEKLKKGEFEKQPKHKTIYEAKEWQRQNPSLYKKLLDSQAKADQARADFEAGLIENEMKNAGLGDKFRVVVKKSSGTLKQLFASFDLSAIAVQNLPFILTQPKTSAKGLPKSFVHMVSPKQFDRMITELHNSPDWQIIKDSGLRVTEPKSLLEATREDYFPDRFKAVVKINGKEYGWVNIGGHKYELLDLSKPFERQFTSLGNLLRVVKFRTEAEILKRKGITFENSPEEYKTLAKRLNNLTSSSDIPAAYQNEITRTLIWSSRLVAAKLNMLGISDVAALIPGTGVNKGYYRGLGVKGQKISRQQAMAVYDLAKFATSVVALTYLVALIKGGTVNTTPTSNQFMDVEYDDGKSMNLTGGFSSYIAKLFQYANWGKTDKYGVFKPYKGTDPIKESITFMASKAPPVTRSVENIVAGKDQFGQDADVSTEASKYKMPLAIGQIYDQIQKDGVGALFTEGLPTLIGFNAKDNRNYNTHKFSNDTEKFIVENQVPISMPQKAYTKNGEKMEMTEDEYKDFLNQVDKEIDNITSDIKKNGGYVIRNNDVVQLSYPQLTKDEVSEMTKEMITEATAKIRKEKFKTDEETDEYIEKSALEELLRETRKAEKDN